MHRRLDIQGFRGIAVALVVAFHVRGAIPGGYVGVDVFFVISGFVISSMLRAELSASGTVSISGFFARRVRRLLPMLAITLASTVVLGVFLLSPVGPSATTSKTAIGATFLNANTFLARQSADYFALPPDANALLHTWSLSVEEQFYLLVPFMLAFAVGLRRKSTAWKRVNVTAVLCLLAGVSFAMFAAGLSGRVDIHATRFGFSSTETLTFYSAPTRAWEFLAGAILAVTVDRAENIPRGLRDALGVVGLLAVILSAVLFSDETSRSASLMAVPVTGSVLVLMAGETSAVGRFLSIRPLVIAGDVSYGWYLFHWPLIVFATANSASLWLVAAAAPISLALALLAKRTVEDKFRSSSQWRGRRLVALIVVCVVGPLAAAGASLVLDRRWRIHALDRIHLRHAATTAGCNQRMSPYLPVGAAACTWPVDHPKGRIVLIGDSHADMWSEAVVNAGNRLGYDVVISSDSACPVLDGTLRVRNGQLDYDCQRYVSQSLREIIALHPDLVLLGAASIGALRGDTDDDPWQERDGSLVRDPARKAELWAAGLTRTITMLRAANIRTVILQDVPYFEHTASGCGRLLFRLRPDSCASSRSLAEVEAWRAPAMKVERQVRNSFPDLVDLIDPVPWFCVARTCSAFTLNTWMYRDRDHLSVDGSKVLAPRMQEALSALLVREDAH